MLLALLSGGTAAHVETFSEAQTLKLGPLNALVEPRPSPAYANTGLGLTAIFSDAATGGFVTDVEAQARVVAPDGTSRETRLEPDGTGYFVGSVVVDQAGEHEVFIQATREGQAHENKTTLTVYPDLPVRIRPGDPEQEDPVAGKPYPITIEVLDAQTLSPSDALDDLALVLERWTDDHQTKLGERTAQMEPLDEGRWRHVARFDDAGMVHLRFSSVSGGFDADDVPILHLYALAPLPGEEPQRTPGAALAAVLGALALVALTRRR